VEGFNRRLPPLGVIVFQPVGFGVTPLGALSRVAAIIALPISKSDQSVCRKFARSFS